MADRDTWELIEGAARGSSGVLAAEEEDGWTGRGGMRWRPRPEPIVQPQRTAPLRLPLVVHLSEFARTPVGVLMRAVDELSRRGAGR